MCHLESVLFAAYLPLGRITRHHVTWACTSKNKRGSGQRKLPSGGATGTQMGAGTVKAVFRRFRFYGNAAPRRTLALGAECLMPSRHVRECDDVGSRSIFIHTHTPPESS